MNVVSSRMNPLNRATPKVMNPFTLGLDGYLSESDVSIVLLQDVSQSMEDKIKELYTAPS